MGRCRGVRAGALPCVLAYLVARALLASALMFMLPIYS